jgi:transcriptional regulator with XRE-family HTH domain
MAEQYPVVPQRRLLLKLREIRGQRNLTQAQVAGSLGWSTSKLLRIENGKNNVSRSDLRALLDVYGVTDPARLQDLSDAAGAARAGSVSHSNDVVTREYRAFLGFEGSARRIRHYEPLLIPGQLQTKAYAEAIIRALSAEHETDDVVEQRVQLRLESQQIHRQDPPPRMHFIVNEAAIRRQVGGRAAMLRQLAHLKVMNGMPHLTIQIMPFDVGAYPEMTQPFIILELPDDPDGPLLYRENASRQDLLSRKQDQETSTYLERFADLAELAAPATWFDRMIDDAIASMSTR